MRVLRGPTPPRSGVLGAAIATLAMLPFCPSLGGGFIYDDNQLVANNVFVHSLRWWPRWLTTDFWDTTEELKRIGARAIYWRPGVTASYALDWWIGRGSPVVLHATNLLWHAAVSVLAFVTLRRWSGNTLAAFVGALLFAVHPTKAESVAWIAGRTDLLCLAGMLVATLGFAKRARGKPGGLALEAVGTVFAYLAKEQAIVLPLFYAVEAWSAMGKPAIDRTTVLGVLRRSAAQLVVACAYLGLRAWLLPLHGAGAGTAIGPGARIAIVGETLGRFAMLTFAPHDLSVEQGLIRMEHGRIVHSLPLALLGVMLVALVLVAGYRARRTQPFVSVGLGFYLFALLPTANLVPTELTAMVYEHFLYVPVLGIGYLVAEAGPVLERRARTAVTLVAAAVCIGAGAQAASRSADFADADAFWARELALHPESLAAIRYHVARAVEQRKFPKALSYIADGQRMAALHHGGSQATDLALRGVELASLRVPDRDTETLRRIERFYGALLTQTSGTVELDLGEALVRIPLETRDTWATAMRPMLLGWRASILSRMGDDEAAVEMAKLAYEACPGCADVGRTAALVYARSGDYARARAVTDDVARWLDEEAVAPTRALIARAQAFAADADRSSGIARTHARAMELSTLEAYGRAYALLAPHSDEIERAPDYAVGFAELAFRAGELDAADRILRAVLPPSRIEPTRRAWAEKTGWLDGG